MNPLKEFSIPIKGLKQEHYEFDFQLDKSFFACFEDSPVSDGDISVYLDLDKRVGMIELFFDIEGTIKTECDRCLVEIDLPFAREEHLVVKYSDEPQEDTDEIIFIPSEAPELNVAQYIYEYISLALPGRRVYDCENDEIPPCDTEMLNRISGESNLAPQSEDDENTQSLGSLLKNISIN